MVTCSRLYLPRMEIGIELAEAIGKSLDIIRKDITFHTRGRRYGTVEVKFASEGVALKPIEPLRSTNGYSC